MQRQSVTHHLPPADRCPTNPPAKATSERLSAAGFVAERDVVWHGISLWSAGSAVPALSPPYLLPGGGGHRVRHREVISDRKNIGVLVANLNHSTM